MAFTEIAIAVITTGPAYIAVWLTARGAQGEPAQPQACAQRAVCGQCEGRATPDSMSGNFKAWALAA
ncbi:hypothetical protein GCM10010449_22110 [Streptomyces rectiviolaceus]|uniref:Uncharacterized protein n=1 Tax=Streptomyces rectiviolaceus TaxID=332591 RepID=A0ABP6MEV4_9ACTN